MCCRCPHTASPCCSSCDCTEGQLLLRYSSEYTNRGLKKAKKTDIVSHGICVLYKTGFSLNMLSIRGRKFFYQRLGTRKMSKLHLWVSWVIKLTEHSIPHSYSNSWKHLSGTLFKQWCLNLFKRNALITPLFSVSSFFFFFLSYWWEMIQRTDIPFKNISSWGIWELLGLSNWVPKSSFHLLIGSLQSANN